MRAASPVLLLVIVGGCGGGECAEGTIRHRDTCLLFDPFDQTPPVITVDPPVRTRNVGNVRLTANEPATIYVTTDDTPPTLTSPSEADQIVLPAQPNDAIVRFFAVDLAGNQSAEQTVLWNIDQQGPASPLGFRLTLAGSDRSLAWQPPSDPHLGGVLVARVEGRLEIEPESGKSYEVGEQLAPGITIVDRDGADAAAATFTENLPAAPGLVRYVAWGFDDLLNYGPPAGDFALVPLPPQFGTLLVSAPNETVTVSNPKPSNITFSGSATFVAATNQLTANISLRNDTTRTLYAPKVLVSNNLGSVTWANSDGEISSKPFRAYGGAVQPGSTLTAQWVFANVAANATVRLDIVIQDNPVMLGSQRDRDGVRAATVIDLVTSQQIDELRAGPTGQHGGAGTLGGGFTPDGRVVFGSRANGTINSFDMASGAKLASATLQASSSHVAQLALDRSGTSGYAIVGEGHPRDAYQNGASTPSVLVRFDASTLREHGRLDLGQSRNRELVFGPGETTLLVATGIVNQGVVEVDLATFKIVRRLVTGTRPDSAIVTPDGAKLVVVGTQIELVDLASGVVDRVIPLPAGGGRVLRTVLGGVDQIWIGRSGRTDVISLAVGGPEPIAIPRRGRLLNVFDGKVYVGDGGSLVRFELDGSADPTATFVIPDNKGHWLGRSPF